MHHLQTGSDPECRLFQQFAEHGHYGGRKKPTPTRQGTYAATPSGQFLASINSNDAEPMLRMLEKALAKWRTLPKEERLRADLPRDLEKDRRRFEARFPERGLVLRVNSRDLPRTPPGDEGKPWNQDFAWFRPSEARAFLPEKLEVGARTRLPDEVVRRIARAHLVDNVRGQTEPFLENAVEKAVLGSEVASIESQGTLVKIHLEGETLCRSEGTWSVNGYGDMNSPSAQKRGVRTKIVGRAAWNVTDDRFVNFEMVAVGERWGGTQYNARGQDLAAQPIGWAFTLGEAHERVAPAFVWVYAWRGERFR